MSDIIRGVILFIICIMTTLALLALFPQIVLWLPSKAVEKTLETYRTYDIMEEDKTKVGTREMGNLIAEAIVES